jgi:hypothetical protein
MYNPTYSNYKDQINIIKFYTTIFTGSIFGIIITTFINKDLSYLNGITLRLLFLYCLSIMCLVVIGNLIWEKISTITLVLKIKEDNILWLQNQITFYSDQVNQIKLELLKDTTDNTTQLEEIRKLLEEQLNKIEYTLDKHINVEIADQNIDRYMNWFRNFINFSVFFLILSLLSILIY